MVFYVYIDPAVIEVAERDGPYALQGLIAALRGFTQNCCVMEFEDWRVQNAIKEKVDALPGTHDRKLLKSLLAVLAKRNRFIYCMTPDYSDEKTDTAAMLEQAATLLIDLALLGVPSAPDIVVPDSVQVAQLCEYQGTGFENERIALVSDGSTTAPGEMDESSFLDTHFGKAFRYAARIDVCDKLFGRKFGDNYKYTAEKLIRWLGTNLNNPAGCKLVFHCEKPAGKTDQFLEGVLRDVRDKHAPGLSVEVQYYQLLSGDNPMPHERFIQTDQIALEVDRGMDFLDAGTAKSRDVFVSYKGLSACAKVLKAYSAGRLPAVTV